MSKELTSQQQPGSSTPLMPRIVVVAMIVFVCSPAWGANNARAHSSASGNWMTAVVTFRRNSVNLVGDRPQSFAGPRPYIDVTAYGCKGDAITNDTVCIQAAIIAACAFTVGGQLVHPIVVFPPGYYFVTEALGEINRASCA